MKRPDLTIKQILEWLDAYHKRWGKWPRRGSGRVRESPNEDTWMAIHMALRNGLRGLPGGSSLIRLLAQQRGARNRLATPPLSVEQILAWADAYHRRTGRWPINTSGSIPGTVGETWRTVDKALRRGTRGLRGRSSLFLVLARHRGLRPGRRRPPLSIKQIMAWADDHHRRTGRWPTSVSGPVAVAKGETWGALELALREGYRGLPAGLSLHRLFVEQRGALAVARHAPLTESKILSWADAHRRRTGRLPIVLSGVIPETGGTWQGVDQALRVGCRGLPGGSSLFQLLRKHGRLDG
jgi:hypothetical protein